MGRPRAGHGWTSIKRGNRYIDVIGTVDGTWITSGEAVGWLRCQRCRRPEELPQTTIDGRRVCIICYYYKCLPPGTFWSHERDYLFPYNIGRRKKYPASEHMRRTKRQRDYAAPGGGEEGRDAKP